MSGIERACWCDDSRTESFSEHYLVCVSCGTLVSQAHLGTVPAQAGADFRDFYGRNYWFSHQRDQLGLPDIDERARLDLPERCLYWLRTLLTYKLPPARTLELGCSHGAFVSLLRHAGLDAIGLEVSRWIVDYAQQTFRIPMLAGPIEEQPLPTQSFDAVILNDVLEHLPDPRSTIQRCLGLLKADGVLFIQTPCYPDPKTYDELLREEHVFLKMLLEHEHIYLFSQRSLRQLLSRFGCHAPVFTPALFPYDMYIVAGRQPLATVSSHDIATALSTTPNSRMALALLDLDDRFRDLRGRYEELRADRESRVQSLLQQHAQLTEQQDTIVRITSSLQQLSADCEARLQVIFQQQATIAEQQVAATNLTRSLQQLSADSEARLQVISQQQATIAEQHEAATNLTRSLQQLSADHEERLQVILQQQATIATLEHTVSYWPLRWISRLLRSSKLFKSTP